MGRSADEPMGREVWAARLIVRARSCPPFRSMTFLLFACHGHLPNRHLPLAIGNGHPKLVFHGYLTRQM